MPKCDFCKKKNHLIFDCTWCLSPLCTSCLACETHACSKIDEMKATKNEQLKKSLLDNKTVRDKMKIRI
jgi:hypothetical protein